MFGKMFEIGSLMKQAHEFSGKIQEMNDRLKHLRIQGSAAGGLVLVDVNGLQEMVSCRIDPALFQQGDVELLEELIVTATNNATESSRQQQAESMKSLTEGMNLGNLTETLEKIMPQ
ncbi:MAG: YbaB/EbfC family nucleoid-associated protein [Planctomycetaceae bacterium]|jgi:DNA-binding YbaB/EbfC family protein|nr:YbaB/EbfC family nucleoid-associated protein [Planctomycetaceae bacterium]